MKDWEKRTWRRAIFGYTEKEKREMEAREGCIDPIGGTLGVLAGIGVWVLTEKPWWSVGTGIVVCILGWYVFTVRLIPWIKHKVRDYFMGDSEGKML